MPIIDSEVTKYQCDAQDSSKKIQKKSGHWNQVEHESYLRFLQENANHNKGQRLFKRMSQVIGTRTPSQCRSHHQKFNPQKPCDKISYSDFLQKFIKMHIQNENIYQLFQPIHKDLFCQINKIFIYLICARVINKNTENKIIGQIIYEQTQRKR